MTSTMSNYVDHDILLYLLTEKQKEAGVFDSMAAGASRFKELLKGGKRYAGVSHGPVQAGGKPLHVQKSKANLKELKTSYKEGKIDKAEYKKLKKQEKATGDYKQRMEARKVLSARLGAAGALTGTGGLAGFGLGAATD
jgi:ribosomal protein L19E